MKRVVSKVLMMAGVASGLAWGSAPARACEPIQQLLLFADECKCEPDGTVVPGTQQLCWGSSCRSFDNDSGQFGQLKKDAPGHLEAIVLKVHNNKTGQDFDIVQKVQNPVCGAEIDSLGTQTTGLSCTGRYKVKNLSLFDDPGGKLCTFANLDILDTLLHTPKAQHLKLEDANGRICEGETRSGDQWWLYYRICCSPLDQVGLSGDNLVTKTFLVINQDAGGCLINNVRPPKQPVAIPSTFEAPCD